MFWDRCRTETQRPEASSSCGKPTKSGRSNTRKQFRLGSVSVFLVSLVSCPVSCPGRLLCTGRNGRGDRHCTRTTGLRPTTGGRESPSCFRNVALVFGGSPWRNDSCLGAGVLSDLLHTDGKWGGPRPGLRASLRVGDGSPSRLSGSETRRVRRPRPPTRTDATCLVVFQGDPRCFGDGCLRGGSGTLEGTGRLDLDRECVPVPPETARRVRWTGMDFGYVIRFC